MLTWYLTTGMSETSKNSSLSKPKKLSFIYCEMGFPAKLSVLKWCIECQAEDGGVASSLRLRSRSRTLDKLAMVSGATKVKWLDDTFKVFNWGNWKLGKRVKEVLAIFKIWRWVRTPVNKVNGNFAYISDLWNILIRMHSGTENLRKSRLKKLV